MSWLLVFIRFLLASSARMEMEDAGPPSDALNELFCRMFGRAVIPESSFRMVQSWCDVWIQEGCGCGPNLVKPLPYAPTLTGDTLKVGWVTGDVDANTAITYSFEKEWLGDALSLHELYQPAGKMCEAKWATISSEEKKQFMDMFRSVTPKSNPILQKYCNPKGAHLKKWKKTCDLCENPMHEYLPLKRIDSATVPKGIHGFVENDHGPWEIKASTFYYDLDAMKVDVEKILPHLRVPSPSFPAQRRIQVHVVAPLKEDASENRMLIKTFRLIQLYFSDYTFLRLGFPNGPSGEKCGQGDEGDETFKCDVFTDTYNTVISEIEADRAYDDDSVLPVFVVPDLKDLDKFRIIGLRSDNTYVGATEEMSGLVRYGFEIRKSESFAAAIDTARAIAHAISTMTADGHALVGIKDGQFIGIDAVREYAQHDRMRLFDGRPIKEHEQDGQPRPQHFCTSELHDSNPPDYARHWQLAVHGLAMHFYRVGKGSSGEEGIGFKLWDFLTLLLCSNWNKITLVHSDTRVTRNQVLDALGKVVYPEGEGPPEDSMNAFLKIVAEYAFQLSEHFASA